MTINLSFVVTVLLGTSLIACAPSAQHEGTGATSSAVEGNELPANYTRTYVRIYCTPDGESHLQDVPFTLTPIAYAPPASPLYLGPTSLVGVTRTGVFPPHWGESDINTGLRHNTPAVQWAFFLKNRAYTVTSDGDRREHRPGDIVKLEDTKTASLPNLCKGHITVNPTGEETWLQFAR